VIADKFKALKAGRVRTPAATAEEFWALRDVSFEIKRGESVGILGRNGAGKSTLLKILSRITEPTVGRIAIDGRISSLLEVGTGFHPELTGRENIYLNGAILGMTRSEIRARFDEIVSFAEVERFLDTPVKRFSSGMYVRLAFAVAAHLEPDIFIVDEVLAVGDAEFQRRCLGKMRDVATKEGRTVLFVSHNMGAIANLCTRGIVLNKGGVDFEGPVAKAVEHYLVQGAAHVQAGEGLAPHVLYELNPKSRTTPFAITRIETRDLEGRPKPLVASGDACVIRVTFEAESPVARGSLALHFTSYEGSKTLLLSTEPDSGFAMSISKGVNTIECVIERIPFAGGEWTIGAGLWIARTDDRLCWTPEICTLHIEPADVYGAGYLLKSNRSLITTPHQWRRL
jgi:lipopolysaccharide transport system ATP-binding protein